MNSASFRFWWCKESVGGSILKLRDCWTVKVFARGDKEREKRQQWKLASRQCLAKVIAANTELMLQTQETDDVVEEDAEKGGRENREEMWQQAPDITSQDG
jgi:hypothetical protein